MVIISALKTMLIRPFQYIHTALLIYPYGLGNIFIRPCHTDQLDYLIKVLRTGCFCIGSDIDSRSAVFAFGPTGLGAITANLESIPGPIQSQLVTLYKYLGRFKFHQYQQNKQPPLISNHKTHKGQRHIVLEIQVLD